MVDLEYTPPSGDGVVRAATFIDNTAFLPRPGEAVRVRVATDDPTAIQLVDDRQHLVDEVPFYLAGLAVPLLFLVGRLVHIRRLESLVNTPSRSFAMLGAIVAPTGVHLRWRLFLYPVDAAPGADPVAAVALLAVPTVPSGVFPVETKGAPRPFGLVVARAGDVVLWPRGRALPRAVRPRPVDSEVRAPDLPADRPAPGGRSLTAWLPRAITFGTAAALATSLWLTAASLLGQREVLERSVPVVATVVQGPSADSRRARVEYTAEGQVRTAALTLRRATPVSPVTTSGGPGAGSSSAATGTVAIRYDRTDPTSVWQQGDHYPRGEGADAAAGALLFIVVPIGLVGGARARHRVMVERGAHELLERGEIVTGSPPVGAYGLTIWDGRLVYRETALVDVTTGILGRNALRFEPHAVVAIDADGREAPYRWDSAAGASRGGEGEGLERTWWIRRRGPKRFGGDQLELVESLAESPSALYRFRSTGRVEVRRRFRSLEGRPPSSLPALVEYLAQVPEARAGLAHPERLIALVAALTCSHPRAQSRARPAGGRSKAEIRRVDRALTDSVRNHVGRRFDDFPVASELEEDLVVLGAEANLRPAPNREEIRARFEQQRLTLSWPFDLLCPEAPT